MSASHAATTTSAPQPNGTPPTRCHAPYRARARNGSIRAVAAGAAPVPSHSPGRHTGGPGGGEADPACRARRDRLDQPPELRDLIHVGGGRRRGQRHAVPIGQDVMLAPLFLPVHRAGAGPFATAQGPHERRVDGRADQSILSAVQLGQEDLVELLPDPRRLPSREVVTSRSCRCRSPSPAAGTPTGCRS